MPDYAYGEYVYLNNIIGAPEEHHNQFIQNQEPDFYIISLSNLMDETLTLLLKLFVNKIKKLMNKHIRVMDQLPKICKIDQRKPTN